MNSATLFTVTIVTNKGQQTVAFDMNGVEFIRSMRVEVNNIPIMETPFHMHDDGKMLHTICRRNSPTIDTVEM